VFDPTLDSAWLSPDLRSWIQYVAPLESGLRAGFVMYRIVEEFGELVLYDLDRERLFPLTDDPQFLPPLEDVAFGEELVAWGAPEGSEWVIKAYDGRTGTAVTLARMELTPRSVVAPQSANRRVAWLSSTGELELREAP